MDPLKDRVCETPRDVYDHAFFKEERATGEVTRRHIESTALQKYAATTWITVPLTVTADRKCALKSRRQVSFKVSRHRKRAEFYRRLNLIKHRKGRYTLDGKGRIVFDEFGNKRAEADPNFSSHKHLVDFVCYASESAEKFLTKDNAARAPRLRVVILFAVGSEATRHGLTAFLDRAYQPTVLVVVPGVETDGGEYFLDPSGKTVHVDEALGRWGVGIDEEVVRLIVHSRFGYDAPYDIVVLGAYSTGHMGLSATITSNWLNLDQLERVVVFDCLYGELGPALHQIKAYRSNIEIICYIVSSGGNTFKGYNPHRKGPPPSYKDLTLGGVRGWRYINLYFNPNYFMLASARLLEEALVPQTGLPGDVPIIVAETPESLSLLEALKKYTRDPKAQDRLILPPRGTVISNLKIFSAVHKSMPVMAVSLENHASEAKSRIGAYHHRFSQGDVARAIGNAQLLGWAAYGEAWHDLLLVEFGWEYLF